MIAALQGPGSRHATLRQAPAAGGSCWWEPGALQSERSACLIKLAHAGRPPSSGVRLRCPLPAAVAHPCCRRPRCAQVLASRAQFPSTVLYGVADLVAWLWTGASSEERRGEQARHRHHPRGAASGCRPVGEGLADLVGHTPLIRLRSLSEQTGCEVRPGEAGVCPRCAACSALQCNILPLPRHRSWPRPSS